MKILLSIVANAVALFAAAQLVHGISFQGDWAQPETWLRLLLAGAIFGLLNLIVRPIALLLAVPALVLTLGLFYFVLNGLLLWGFSKLMPGFDVAGLWPGILGSLVIMVVNWAVSALSGGKAK
jgi:putative membrane protein